MPSKKQRAKQAKATKQTKDILLPAIVNTIRAKWHEQTKATKGCFIRHTDGDTSNNRLGNLAWCSPHDAFTNPDWTVDWTISLTQEEIDYVEAHMGNFATIYARTLQ
jgi:hypothetical protein